MDGSRNSGENRQDIEPKRPQYTVPEFADRDKVDSLTLQHLETMEVVSQVIDYLVTEAGPDIDSIENYKGRLKAALVALVEADVRLPGGAEKLQRLAEELKETKIPVKMENDEDVVIPVKQEGKLPQVNKMPSQPLETSSPTTVPAADDNETPVMPQASGADDELAQAEKKRTQRMNVVNILNKAGFPDVAKLVTDEVPVIKRAQ